MANEQNLIPFTSNQNREEAKKNGAKGGKKSGEVRRQRKAMKEQMDMLLSLPFKVKDNQGRSIAKMLSALGVNEEDIDNQMAMMIALWKTTLKDGRNQVSAIQEIRKIVQDEQTVSDDDRVQIINDLPQNDFDEGEEDETD